MLRRLLVFLLYCLATLTIVSVCLVLFFPRDTFLGWASNYLEGKLPGIQISVNDIKYVHPLKIRLYELNVSSRQKQWDLPIDALLVSIRPRLPIEHVRVIGVLFGGDIGFDLGLGSNRRLELRDLRISEMRLSEVKMVERSTGQPMQGIVSVSGRATVNSRVPSDIRFYGTIRVEKFFARLKRPVLGETELHLDRMNGDIVLNEGVVDVTNGVASGPLFSGVFSGQIWGAEPLGRSRFEMSGNMVPKPALIEKNPHLVESPSAPSGSFRQVSIPYRIEGTIAEPRISFDPLK